MTVKLTIKTDNAAFEDQSGMEVARILREAAGKVENWPGYSEFAIGLRDFNGNKVGEMEASE